MIMSIRMKISDINQMIVNGIKEVEVNGKTVSECIKDLITKYPALEPYIYEHKDEISPAVTIFVNGEIIPYEEVDSPVKDGDEIYPLVIIGGG